MEFPDQSAAFSAKLQIYAAPNVDDGIESGEKQQGKAAGATGWIVKPFNPEQLLNTINKVLG